MPLKQRLRLTYSAELREIPFMRTPGSVPGTALKAPVPVLSSNMSQRASPAGGGTQHDAIVIALVQVTKLPEASVTLKITLPPETIVPAAGLCVMVSSPASAQLSVAITWLTRFG